MDDLDDKPPDDETEEPRAEEPQGDKVLPLVACVAADADNLELLHRVLETTGRYRVVGARDGLSGLELVRRERPALVLLDLDLPVVDGLETFRRLRADQQLASIPVVAMSASVMRGERQRCVDAGFKAFVEQPFDIHELRRLVAELVSA
jgi:two-component system cell cycle response regulator DivK